MRIPSFDRKIAVPLFVLSVTQIIGWGTVGLPAIVGRQMAVDLRMDLSSVFAGGSVFYVVMGLWAPLLARAFARLGARRLMMGGTVLAALGFLVLASSRGPLMYFAAWVTLGTAGSATLSTAAYIMLNELAGAKAKRAIGGLMLLTGLSSSFFWPLASLLSNALSWQGTCAVYAGMMMLVSLPLYVFGLPAKTPGAPQRARSLPAAAAQVPARRSTFYFIAAAIALNAFVTFGFSAIFIELLKAVGLPAVQAVAFGSALGVIQVGARAVDFLGGGKWDGVSTGIFAGIALPVAMVLLIVGHGSHSAVVVFVVVYGLGSGALAVARATIPLVFYDQAEYALAASRIALPLNVISAAAPPLFIALLIRLGSDALLEVAILCSGTALLLLLLLTRRRPALDGAAPAA
ncbi:MFS transporter [Paraburkholderia phenazinium]|uniref:Predicted arabinose efflux permease, MFS family n=1 Tax=Paraburkholderia phenazinium TaxID=60549 RepID=A0A1N6L0B1_9BURK|nr:MFS transporter [Paraburkholderia phenazinium]SIO62218.1 Predicted arabinose efflux permease, MFS family [Paraburkholderia phenazinium]